MTGDEGTSDRGPIDDLGRLIADHVRKVVTEATAAASDGGRADREGEHGEHDRASGTSIAAAINIGGRNRTASAYVDDDVVIVQRDGKRYVRRIRNEEADRSGPSEPES